MANGSIKLHTVNSSTVPPPIKVRYKRKDLLAHELVTSFLCMRWNTFLKYFYYTNLLTYIILMLLLTIYMHIYFKCESPLDTKMELCSAVATASVIYSAESVKLPPLN